MEGSYSFEGTIEHLLNPGYRTNKRTVHPWIITPPVSHVIYGRKTIFTGTSTHQTNLAHKAECFSSVCHALLAIWSSWWWWLLKTSRSSALFLFFVSSYATSLLTIDLKGWCTTPHSEETQEDHVYNLGLSSLSFVSCTFTDLHFHLNFDVQWRKMVIKCSKI